MSVRTTASESTKRFIFDGIRYVCESFKRRSPGSAAERDAQLFMKSELEKYSDCAAAEDFAVRPDAFLGWMPYMGPLSIAGTSLFWLTYFGVLHGAAPAIAKMALYMLMFVWMLHEFLLYRQFFDFLYPKKASVNVFASRAPTGEVKRRIIFCGHADAAFEWRYSYFGKKQRMIVLEVVYAACIGGAVEFFLTAAWLVLACIGTDYSSPLWTALGVFYSVMSVICTLMCFFENKKVVVDGANDNLSACYVGMALLKDMAESGERFEHTEVCCLITGCEEAGLRGSLAYARAHKSELLDTETVVVAMDTLREVEFMEIYTMGETGTQRSSNAVGELIHEAGMVCGVDMRERDFYPGAIDSEAFSRRGIEAAGFCGVDGNPKTYYHTRMDNADNIGEECILLSLNICKEIVRLYDERGGIDAFREAGAKRFKRGSNVKRTN